MSTITDRFDPGQILQPVLPSALTRTSPVGVGASLTIAKGQAMARKTSDAKFYALNLAATDGTQIFAGFSQYPFSSDANGLVYLITNGAAGVGTWLAPPSTSATIFTGGIFDPTDLITAATGTAVAEVDTFTPASVTTGDIYSVTNANGTELASFTVAGTATAAAAVTGLTNSWNSNPVAKALATASGGSTFILTAATAGQPLTLTASAVGTGTFTKVVTTAATNAQQAEVDTFTASSPTTADVYTLTATLPGAQTVAVSSTVGATQTATAIDALLIAAWNSNPTLAGLATASGTTTLVLTAVNPGIALSVAATVAGTGTMSKVVTKPALGRSINDILAGNPGAHVLQPSGYWEIP